MQSINDLKRKTISGVVSYGIRTAILYVIAILATAVLGIYLDPEEFGIYYVVISVIGFFTFLSDVGLAAALVQSKEEPTQEDLRTTFTVQQGLALTIFIFVIALTPLWKKWANLDQEGLKLLYVLAFSFVLASFKTIPSILLERKLHFHKLIIPQFAEQICFYGIAVVLAIKGFGVASFTYAVLVRSIVGVASIYALQSWNVGLGVSRKALDKLLKFGVKFQLNDLLARLKDDLFVLVLAKFLPAAEIGFIGWAKRWSMFPYQFSVNNVVAITFPTYSRLQEHKQLLGKAVEKSIFFITLIIFPVLIGLCISALPITFLIPEYAKWRPALPSLYLFSINIAFAATSTPLTNTLNAIGEINKTLKLMIMWTVMTWGLTPLAVIKFGFTGVALVSALVAVTSLISIWMVKKVMPVRISDQVWRQLFAAALMGIILWQLRTYMASSWMYFILIVLLGALIYGAGMMLVGYRKTRLEIESLLLKKHE